MGESEGGKEGLARAGVIIITLRICIGALAGCLLCAAVTGCVQRGSNVLEVWEPPNPTIKVRILKYDEWPQLFLAQYYFTVEAVPPDSEQWTEVMTWRVDDPQPIPRQHIGFVNQEVAYAFGKHEYVVTTDRGLTWVKWNAAEALQRLGLTLFSEAGITNVTLTAEGHGKMTVLHKTETADASRTFATSDFGKHWTAE